jgi:molybdenum cofactor cytidylyltransferase
VTGDRGFAGLVLAAGASRRFGSADKLLAPLRGRPLAAHAAAAARASAVGRWLAVTAVPDVAALFGGFEIVTVPRGCLKVESLRAGMARLMEAPPDGVAVVLGDMPRVTAALIDAVVARAKTHGAAASLDGVRRSPPAAFLPAHFAALAAAEGDRGAGALLRALPQEALVPAAGLLDDVDTEGDLRRLGG